MKNPMLYIVSFILLSISAVAGSSKGHWSYDNVKQWNRGNRYCAGNLQSPINLQFNLSHYDNRLQRFYFEERFPRDPAELINSGHTVQLNIKNHYVLKNIAPASEEFKVEQIHFHWGHSTNDRNGSEHLHEGQSYPLEMHVVSYSSWYSNIREAMANTRSLAVVGAFFEISEEPNPLLQPLIDALGQVRRQNDHTYVSEAFSLKALLGEERLSRYYRYDGSLTTPPCYETVIWTVLLEPLKLSLQQLHAFRFLHDEKAHLMQNTYRPVQKLGTRKLFRSFLAKDIEEDEQLRILMKLNHGQYLTYNINLIVLITSILMMLR